MNEGRLTALFSATFLGGSELFNLEYLRRGRELGVSVHALVPGPGPLSDALEPLAETIEYVEIPATLRRMSRFGGTLPVTGLPAQAYSGAVHGVRLRRALRRTSGPICAFGLRAQLSLGVQPSPRGRPVAWVVHEVVPHGPVGRLWARAARKADLVLAQSEAAATQPYLAHSRVEVGRVVLDLDAFEAVPDPATPPTTLGLVGDLFPLKNHLGFLEVVDRLHRDTPVVSGLIVGRPNDSREELERYGRCVREAVDGAAVPVRLTSGPPAAMPGLVGEIDLLLHLSTVPETFGRVCAEAMAAGRPVVGFDHGAVREVVVDGQTGVLCPPGSLDAIVEEVRALTTDSARFRALSRAARSRVSEMYGKGQLGTTVGDRLAAFAINGRVEN